MAQKTPHIDDLVATYAARGRVQKQSGSQLRLRRAGWGVLAAALVVVSGIGAWQYDAADRWQATQNLERERAQSALASVSAQLQQAEALRSALAQELDIIVEQRNELNQQQANLRTQQAVMAEKLAALADQQHILDEQRQLLIRENEQIAESAAQLTARRAALSEERQQVDKEAPELSAALQEVRAQRQELDEEHQRFRAQRQLLEQEINRLNEQRANLQDQQQALKNEWESLQSLMEQAASNNPTNDGAALKADHLNNEQATNSASQPVDHDTTELLIAATEHRMQDTELGQVRGAFNIGSQREISIGLSRIVDINGVQQYSSTFDLSGANAADLGQLASMHGVVIQNGPGNLAAADLASYTGSVPVVIQNTLDNQHILNTNVLDITIGNVAGKAAGVAASMAISDSLTFHK